ncbi:hypothetical protein QZH41_009010 [Actinostola sp. cb2023]|nr:hypothetical protein QZH41_009010 [Actinostola sp. cb2023]
MSEIHSKSNTMTPQISPKDIPQTTSDSESEEEPAMTNIMQESSSSEDDDGEVVSDINSGYVPLSMNDGNDINDSFIQQIEVESNELENSENQQLSEDTSSSEISALVSTSSSNPSKEQTPMDNDQVRLIQNVMSNISLPTSSIPEWAKLVPEDRWKNSLLTSLENRTQTTTRSKCSKTDLQE